ncbi:glycosyltransferase family 4 protein [Pseudomonas sp. BN414]|uniref:glycosyltransferase family 4 protein n=1 Tax=Pseudomonas sp. BN414 TaxID=2567888 RepID=UPI0024562E74|nr:glycosyltransferase family 4 protein [Pseudomonas sp. BN414]MDH4568438.1 glycosyltransferase family 4 protein [Pseudomonas sp. BN414]
MKSKVLFLVQLPPPIHGASVVNKSIQDSVAINNSFSTKFVNISPANDISDIGKISPRKILAFLAILFRAITSFIRFKPDLVYITLSPHGLAFFKDGLLAILLKFFGGRLVFHLHGKGIREESRKSRIKHFFYKHVFKKAEVIHLAESLLPDIEPVRDRTIEPMVVANGIWPISDSYFLPKEEKFTFIYLSNLIRSKGADILIRAASLIPEEFQDSFQVKIIGKKGDEAYFKEVMKLINHNPYGNISLLGALYGKEKYEALSASHVFVLPTRFKNECFPLSILEAMAAGLAVISTNEGAIPEIITSGETGEVLVDCTPEELAKAMIKHIKDSNYSNRCAQNSYREFTEKYTVQNFESNLIKALEQASQ